MKNIGKKLSVLLCAVILLMNITGCGKQISISDTTDKPTEQRMETSINSETISLSEEVPLVEYGDTVTFECTEKIYEFTWEDKGEKIFTVDDNTDVFFPISKDDIFSETDVNRYQKRAIGKHVGESFVLWFTDDEGHNRGFEYTILEILDKDINTVEQNDRLHVNYTSMRRPQEFENVSEPFIESHGEASFSVSEYSYEFCPNIKEYDLFTARDNVNRVLGKKTGETFRIFDMVSQTSYQYTINKIEKAVAYGDKIRTSVRETTEDDNVKTTTVQHKELALELRFLPQKICIGEKILSQKEKGAIIKSLSNIKLGEEMKWFPDNDGPILRDYTLKLTDIQKGNISSQVTDAETSLLYADPEMLHYISISGKENWFRIVEIDDSLYRLNVFEFDEDSNCIEQLQKNQYTIEYDRNWNVIAEHLEGDSNRSYAYVYNQEGNYAKRKVYTSGILDYIDYFNEEGTEIIERHHYMGGEWVDTIDVYKDGILSCRISYTEDGYETESYEKDEWCFETGM